MDLIDALKACARRWYVFLPLIIATGFAAYVVHGGVKPQYVGSLSIGIAAPSVSVANPTTPATTGVTRTNALLDSGGPTLVADLVVLALREPAALSVVATAGGTLDYSAVVSTRSNKTELPIVTIGVAGSSADLVSRTLVTLLPLAKRTVTIVQRTAGVPNDLDALSYTVQQPLGPGVTRPGQVRAVAAVVAAGLLITLILTVIVDSAMTRRRQRRRQVSRLSVPASG